MTEPTVEETINANLEPGHPNDLVDRVGELEEPEPPPEPEVKKKRKYTKKAKSK